MKVPICHPEKIHYAKDLCRKCYWHSRYIVDRERILAVKKAYVNANKDKIYARQKAWDLKTMPYLRRHYGVTAQDYSTLLEKQNGCCAICRRHQTMFKRKLAVDHNHITKKVRGLLCGNCNLGLGNLQDNTIILKNALTYLEAYVE